MTARLPVDELSAEEVTAMRGQINDYIQKNYRPATVEERITDALELKPVRILIRKEAESDGSGKTA